MIHCWKALDKEITDDECQIDLTFSRETKPSQTLDLKVVEILKVPDKRTYDTSLESSWLGDYRFWISS